jgi:hypothetical protein
VHATRRRAAGSPPRLVSQGSRLPGKALLLDWPERARKGRPSHALARDADRPFSRWSGLPEQLVSDDERGDVGARRSAARTVIGQDHACRQSAEVLARFKRASTIRNG